MTLKDSGPVKCQSLNENIIIIIYGGTKAAQTEKDMDTADERGFVVLQARGHCYDKIRTAAA